ncbi:MAG: stage V sporulation protein AD [Clostridia bacterium]|nr:stage V sporulation protein AD [Clostridia bacterium]
MAHKKGNQTFILDKDVIMRHAECIVGQKESEGPLGAYFDQKEDDDFGMDTWEKGEAKFVESTYKKLLSRCDVEENLIDCILAGDLLNQCTSSACGLKESGRPFLGMFGACSTMAESLVTGSLLIDGGGMNNVVCMTSSNFCSAEKQFRFPLELGSQRAPNSQWTVTGSGAVLLSSGGNGPRITSVTPGIISNYEISDTNNMGAAMAPAAASTILAHLGDLERDISYYDLVVTGDLGITGKQLCRDILKMHGINAPTGLYDDCGAMIFDPVQGTCAGGSGCGCSASVLAGYLMKELNKANINKLLFVATGALMSTVSTKQGESILGIAHAVAIENI